MVYIFYHDKSRTNLPLGKNYPPNHLPPYTRARTHISLLYKPLGCQRFSGLIGLLVGRFVVFGSDVGENKWADNLFVDNDGTKGRGVVKPNKERKLDEELKVTDDVRGGGDERMN